MKNAPLVSLLNLKLSGVPPHTRLASLMILSVEVEYLKHSLCYVLPSAAFMDDVRAGRRPSWETFVRENAGISATRQRQYLSVWQVVKGRMLAGANDIALALSDERPSALIAAERSLLIVLITEVLTENDTFLSLRREAAKLAPADFNDNLPPRPREPSVTDLWFQNEAIKDLAAGAGMAPGIPDKVASIILSCERLRAREAVKELMAMFPPRDQATP
jgi:hypothetical protein